MFETLPKSESSFIKALGSTREESTEEEVIYVMPKKFRRTSSKKPSLGGKGGPKWLIIILIVVFFITASSLGFYFWAKKYLEKEKTPPPEIEKKEEIPPPPPETKQETPPSEEMTLKAEIKDEEGNLLSRAELYLPEGAIPPGTYLEIKTESPKETVSGPYKILAGIYKIEPKDLILTKSVNLKIFYTEKLVEKTWEDEIKIAYFKDGFWTPLSGGIDKENKFLSTNFEVFPSDVFALVVEQEKITQPPPPSLAIPSSLDTDNDGLTDTEETLYGTDPKNPDTDGDGVPDGREVLEFSNPKSPETGAKLSLSGLVNSYNNENFNYSLFYPALWLVRAVPETANQEILIVTNTGELFNILVEENPENLELIDWYKIKAPDVSPELLKTETISGKSCLWSPDRLTVYLKGEKKVYILSYNPGTEEKINFKTTFEMMIRNFSILTNLPEKPSEEMPAE